MFTPATTKTPEQNILQNSFKGFGHQQQQESDSWATRNKWSERY